MNDYMKQQMLELVNIERINAQLLPLTLNEQATRAAQRKADDMLLRNYFSHISPIYGSLYELLSQFDVQFSSAAENLAKGSKTAESTMELWMNSEGHRKNILNPVFTGLGAGYTEGNNTTYWVQIFISK